MNIKKLLSDFGSWVFSGLTFFGISMIYTGIGGRGRYAPVGETNWYFVGIGVILTLPFAFYMIKAKLISNKVSDESVKRINNLIKTGDKLIIDLDNLKIQTNSYTREILVGSGYQKRHENIDVNHNIILLEVPYHNELIKYKLNIYMEPTKLKMHFAVKRTTELYVDAENPNNNYLNLTFLES